MQRASLKSKASISRARHDQLVATPEQIIMLPASWQSRGGEYLVFGGFDFLEEFVGHYGCSVLQSTMEARALYAQRLMLRE